MTQIIYRLVLVGALFLKVVLGRTEDKSYPRDSVNSIPACWTVRVGLGGGKVTWHSYF